MMRLVLHPVAILSLGLLLAAPGPARAKGDPAAACTASLYKAFAKACNVEFACGAKFLKDPAKDPLLETYNACVAKNDAKLESAIAKAQAKAAQQGAVCSADPVRLETEGLISAISRGLLAGWSPVPPDPVDDVLRSNLLKAGGKACGQALSVISKQALKPSDSAFEKGMLKTLVGFAKSAGKAAAKAEPQGGGVDLQLLQAVVDFVGATAERIARGVDESGGSAEVFEVSSGNEHSCLLRTDGSVACWGGNTFGQSSSPAKDFLAVSAGRRHSCGIRDSDDRAECWGNDVAGQVSSTPTDELGFLISAGGFHTCALRLDQTAVCWGANDFGQATPPDPTRQYVDISAGEFHTCGVRLSDGGVECWGDTTFNQTSAPPGSFRRASAGWELSCGIQDDSSLACWGSTPPPDAGIYFDVSAGRDFACALSSNDRTAACWGALGPWRAPPDNVGFFQISAGGRHTCGVRESDSQVVCWGNDDVGQTSCAGVDGCAGTAAPPCMIANEGPLFGEAGGFVIREVLGDPNNDYRLIVSKDRLDVLRDIAPGSDKVSSLVDAFDERGFSCSGDDRIAIDFPAETLEATNLLHELGLLDPLVGFVIDEIYEPIKDWYVDQIYSVFEEFLAQCLIELVLFQSSCV
jgi:hypothetical protein